MDQKMEIKILEILMETQMEVVMKEIRTVILTEM